MIERERRIGLLFSDIVMPDGMSGIDLAREVRRKRRDVAVLLTSGYTAQSLAQDPELEEEFRILRKPYRREALAAGLRAVLDTRDSSDARPRGQPVEPAGVLAGARVLVVEDEALLALLLKTELTDLGCKTIGPIARLEEALEVAHREPLDGALLDVNLGSRKVYPVADALLQRGVPFAFVSGYGDSHHPDAHRSSVTLVKPYRGEDLKRTLLAVLSQRSVLQQP